MFLSVIIPTYRRRDILRQTLECIAKQTLLHASSTRAGTRSASPGRQHDILEVIVVSDGPDEKTAEMIQSLEWPFGLQHFAIPKSQQGIARNRAAEKARGKYCLLIGDDIFLMPDACEKHLQAHENLKSRMAVLGFTTWDPTLRITPLMRWLEESGVQFGYPMIQKFAGAFLPPEGQHKFTYTSNLSLPTRLLQGYPFREDISRYGWEDIEWGKRLADADISLFYEPSARAFHHHTLSEEEVWVRSRNLGVSAMEMERLVSDFKICPRGWKKLAYYALALLPTYRGRHYRAFLKGMREGTKENTP